MKILIVEDEFISRVLLTEMLTEYGTCHVATNGREALEAIQTAFKENERYDLVCLDIMMPEMDGQQVLIEIRKVENLLEIGGHDSTRVIMTTALKDSKNIMRAFTQGQCEAYLTKPIDKEKLVKHLHDLELI